MLVTVTSMDPDVSQYLSLQLILNAKLLSIPKVSGIGIKMVSIFLNTMLTTVEMPKGFYENQTTIYNPFF